MGTGGHTMVTKTQAKAEKPEQKTVSVTSGMTNLDKIKQLKQKLSQGTRGNNDEKSDRLPFFKSGGKVGTSFCIRFLPLPFMSTPILYVKEHHNLFPDQPYRNAVCPKSTGDGECPICEYTYTKWKELKEKNDEAGMKALVTLMAKDKVYAVIYNRSTNRVEKISMSATLANQIFTEWDPDSGEDITDPYKGNDYTLKLSPSQKSSGFTYSASKVTMPDGKGGSLPYPTPIITDAKGKPDKEAIQAILDEVAAHEQEIRWLITPLPYDDLAKLLKHEADTGEASEDTSDATGEDFSAAEDEDVEAALAAVRK